MSEALLSVQEIEVGYRGAGLGVQGLSLDVFPGEIVAMLGANGAGKTTTLRAISGFLPGDIARVTGGKVLFHGRNQGGMPPHRRVWSGMSIVPERDKVFRSLTIDENLRVATGGRGSRSSAGTLDMIYELFPALVERRSIAAGYLSGGERQMLAIGRALMTGPTLLLADEISLGIAPGLVVELLDTVRRINVETGVTMLVVEQNAAAALRISDRVYVLEHGRSLLNGTPQELLGREDFLSTYFGIAEDDDRSAAAAGDEDGNG